MFVKKSKCAEKEILDMKKQGSQAAKAASKSASELDSLGKEFWILMNKGLRNELANTACGVLENAASLLVPDKVPLEDFEFSAQDLQRVLRCHEMVKHAIWDTLSADLAKEKKVQKLFDFYSSLAEQAITLVRFALSKNSRTQHLFQGAALPEAPAAEELRSLKGLPDQLKELSDEASALGWEALLEAVDAELADQQSAGFKALGMLIEEFLKTPAAASKAKLEEVKLGVPQKSEGREVIDAAFQAFGFC